jgi:CII-binding regulator of phage lambda lysogenization HflD
MADWLPGGREQGQRLARLERELEAAKATASSQADRLDTLARGVDSLGDRISALAETLSPLAARLEEDRAEFAKIRTSTLSLLSVELDRIEAVTTAVAALSERVEALESLGIAKIKSSADERAKAQDADLVTLRTSMLRIERQLAQYWDEAQKTGLALLERIELIRRSVRPVAAEAEPGEPTARG